MAVAGQVVVGDRRAFTTQVAANNAAPDLTVVVSAYYKVLRDSGTTETWTPTITSSTPDQLLLAYAFVPGNNDIPGETLSFRPYLVIVGQPDTPCMSFQIQVVPQ